jgi:hypothetical protein
MRARMLAIDAGTSYHHVALTGRYAGLFDRVAYVRDLAEMDLGAFDVVVVTCRTPACRLEPHRAQLRSHLDRGGTLVAMGETEPWRWLDDIRFTPVPTNYWWWLEPGADLGIRTLQPGHDLWRHLPAEHVVWHYHGHFAPPAGATTLVTCREGGAVLYEDAVSTGGRLILTSLDPFYHHGSYFMPAATRFLDGFLAWLRQPDADRGTIRRRRTF